MREEPSSQSTNVQGEAVPERSAGALGKFGRVALPFLVLAAVAGGVIWQFSHNAHSSPPPARETASLAGGIFRPSTTQWAALTVETVTPQSFRSVVSTDGRIAIDEDNTTPIFSPYAGRVLALHAKAGDRIEAGQPLFTIAATDMVQAQNELVSAISSLNKANSALRLAEVNLTRARNLYEVKAGSQRDFQAAEDQRNASEADKNAAVAALGAARNRLRLLGKTDAEIDAFQKDGRISPETVIKAPLSGTVVQRKVGPGQFVAGAQSDPVFVIGDLTNVWIVANVKESDGPQIGVGAPIEFRVLALPDRTFTGKIDYVASTVDSNSRRIPVRARISNPDGALKPEMFAMVDLVTSKTDNAASISRSAIVYEGDTANVWLVAKDKSITKRRIKIGASSGNRVQVVDGIMPGDQIISRGSLFIDRVASTAD